MFGMGDEKNWVILRKTHMIHHAFWFKKLLYSEDFTTKLIERYKALRKAKKPLSYPHISFTIDHLTAQIKDAIPRDRKKWRFRKDLLEHTIMNISGFPKTYKKQIQGLKIWIKNRLSWMDSHINELKIRPSSY